MKDFWKLSGFKSTKYNYITFHIVMTLTGYLFFQIYKNLEEGQAYTGRSLPVAAKNYKETKPKEIVIYVGQYFGIFPFLEFLKIYAECTLEVRQLLDPVLAKVQQVFCNISKRLIEDVLLTKNKFVISIIQLFTVEYVHTHILNIFTNTLRTSIQ